MSSKILADPRIDPRLKALFPWPDRPPVGDIEPIRTLALGSARLIAG